MLRQPRVGGPRLLGQQACEYARRRQQAHPYGVLGTDGRKIAAWKDDRGVESGNIHRDRKGSSRPVADRHGDRREVSGAPHGRDQTAGDRDARRHQRGIGQGGQVPEPSVRPATNRPELQGRVVQRACRHHGEQPDLRVRIDWQCGRDHGDERNQNPSHSDQLRLDPAVVAKNEPYRLVRRKRLERSCQPAGDGESAHSTPPAVAPTRIGLRTNVSLTRPTTHERRWPIRFHRAER